jgi:hypothetical protein
LVDPLLVHDHPIRNTEMFADSFCEISSYFHRPIVP